MEITSTTFQIELEAIEGDARNVLVVRVDSQGRCKSGQDVQVTDGAETFYDVGWGDFVIVQGVRRQVRSITIMEQNGERRTE